MPECQKGRRLGSGGRGVVRWYHANSRSSCIYTRLKPGVYLRHKCRYMPSPNNYILQQGEWVLSSNGEQWIRHHNTRFSIFGFSSSNTWCDHGHSIIQFQVSPSVRVMEVGSFKRTCYWIRLVKPDITLSPNTKTKQGGREGGGVSICTPMVHHRQFCDETPGYRGYSASINLWGVNLYIYINQRV